MTAISPLQSIHKKGLFGDHHKKDERDLLNISEVKEFNDCSSCSIQKVKSSVKQYTD